LKVVISL